MQLTITRSPASAMQFASNHVCRGRIRFEIADGYESKAQNIFKFTTIAEVNESLKAKRCIESNCWRCGLLSAAGQSTRAKNSFTFRHSKTENVIMWREKRLKLKRQHLQFNSPEKAKKKKMWNKINIARHQGKSALIVLAKTKEPLDAVVSQMGMAFFFSKHKKSVTTSGLYRSLCSQFLICIFTSTVMHFRNVFGSFFFFSFGLSFSR